MNDNIAIRAGVEGDLEIVLALNRDEEIWTSELDLDALTVLVSYATVFDVVVDHGTPVGFILVMNASSAYPNANLTWFNSQVSEFWYIDRVVVAKSHAGLGLGRKLYVSTFEKARERSVLKVVCEFSTEPMNTGSAAFHKKMGFREIGTRIAGHKHLSMQLRDMSNPNHR